ncbi:sugar-phosphate isomerase RpiB/LacA/LacB family [Clostridium sp. CAG:440]|nr:sugar-phosphate isomerase RpiB/LacA/LacB family [Clostridium sp. CAG:440]
MIAIGSDHGGYKLKEEIKKYFDEKGIEYRDFGTDSEERTDYPIYAKKVAQAVQSKECEGGILLCRSGYGMTVVANKFKGIRAASISNEEAAKFAKADDDINVITLGGDYLTINEAICIIRNWLAAEFKGGRYAERLEMINDIESQNMK